MKKTFVTLFPKVKNDDYYRDPCMIPYVMTKYYGFDSKLVIMNCDESYSNFQENLPELQLEFIESEESIRGYLKKNATSIDVLNVFFLEMRRSLRWIKWYKRYNPNGIVYVKLDMNIPQATNLLENNSLMNRIKRSVLKKQLQNIDIVSAETTKLKEIMEQIFCREFLYIPDGFYNFGTSETVSVTSKKKQLLTVGNLGTKEKNSKLLMEAYAKSRINQIYDMVLVGARTDDFDEYLENFFVKYPELKEHVSIRGVIRDRNALHKVYEEAEVFVFPSISESFGIAMLEAATHGCYIISTDGVPAFEDIVPDDLWGSCFYYDDIDGLIEIFDNIPSKLAKFDCNEIRQYADKFEWCQICNALNQRINIVIDERKHQGLYKKNN